MGGSFALALKRAGLVKRVDRLQQVALDHRKGEKLGVIDIAAESALLAVSGSDIVLIAVPCPATEATFKAIRHLVEPGVLFMDVGSTKRDVIDAARRVLKERVRASCRRTRSPARKWPASATPTRRSTATDRSS
jgi:prephenate dehydrogenase